MTVATPVVVERLISHYPLERLETAAADMHEGMAIKPVILFEDSDRGGLR